MSLRWILPAIGVLIIMTTPTHAADADACPEGTVPATIETDRGSIRIALDRKAAPATVANFVRYARDGFYADTLFHRVIPGFMIQGGGLTGNMERKSTRAPITNESDNGLSNARGTLAMARTSDPDSATSQFFINLTDNARLDGQKGQPGYTVFARVTEGMDVVDRIAAVETTRRAGHRDVPRETIRIEAVTIADCGEEAKGGGKP
jgi:cyclophilin family peptidyl-prolyl cis-trans isomerase